MSILQDYEEIRNDIGEEMWDSFDSYINLHHPELRLDQIIYNPSNWKEFEEWFNNQIKIDSINVLDVWKTDYDDYRACVEIGKGKIKKYSIIASYEEQSIRNLTGNLKNILSESELRNAFAVLVLRDYDNYLKLPKISNCSKLLQEIYDTVCISDATMAHIDEEDWKTIFSDEFSERDITSLQHEIIKFNLEDVVTINQDGYKIVGYGDLETRFIDDRNLNHNLEESIEIN